MYIVSIVLFLAGIFMAGISFGLGDPWRAIVFVAGILAFSSAMAIPIHTTRRNMGAGPSS